MNKYELALVVSAKIEDDARTATVEKAKEYITRAGGTVTEVEEWGKKKLAYDVQKMSEAVSYTHLIVSCKDSSWLLSWTINRQGQFKEQDKDKVCVWVYGLFTDVPGDFIKKPMKECTGKEITEEWLYHLGVPEDQIEDLAEHSAVCVPTMMPYITAFFMPRTKGDRPDVIPDGCVNFAFLGQFTETPRDTVFTTEYSVRTAMEAVYGLLGVDRGVPEVWGSVYDVRELLDSSVKLMDGKSPLQMNLGPLNVIKKPLLSKIKGTVIEKLLRDHDVLRDGMI